MLRNQLAILSRARVGERNTTLNRCAFIVAKHGSAGHLDECTARSELLRVAGSIGLSEWEASWTVSSAFRAVG